MFVLVACSSSDDSNASPDSACQGYAQSVCSKLQSCAPDLLPGIYTDVPTCTTRLKIECLNAVNAKGTGIKTADVSTCSSAIGSVACDALLGEGNLMPDACRPKAGTLAAGTACQDSSQCTTTYCKVGATNQCGACGTRVAAGSKCESSKDCEFGLDCSANGTCVALGKAGEACSNDKPCGGLLVCTTSGADATAGTCAAPGNAGDKCTGQTCDGTKALFCNPNTQTCQKATFVGPGSPCGLIGGGFVGCSGSGSVCETGDNGEGTCKAGLADGAACGGPGMGSCQSPARCVNSVCTLPTACGG